MSDGVTESHIICTDHLAWVKAGPSPGGCVCGAAIETPPADPVIQLCGSVVRVYGVKMLLSRVVISNLMCSTRYLRWDYMCGRGICCGAGSSFVERIAGFGPWLDTIRGLREASRLLVICTWTLRFGTWITNIGIIRGSDIYVYIYQTEPRLVGAGEDTEERSSEEEESDGDWGRVAIGGGGDGCACITFPRRPSL